MPSQSNRQVERSYFYRTFPWLHESKKYGLPTLSAVITGLISIARYAAKNGRPTPSFYFPP